MIKQVKRKSMVIRPSGRSTDFITPSFGYGCLLNCSYCYMKRHLDKGLTIAMNPEEILTHVNNHAYFAEVEKPNQTHKEFITYDISCNEDFALHSKYHNWEYIFEFFRNHPIAMGSFATKVIPVEFLNFDPEKKIRIRFSLMPQKISSIVEPNTPDIIDRIKAIDAFVEAGYDVHVNYSPVIVYDTWLEDYKELFQMMEDYVDSGNKKEVLSEVIFLTHNHEKHFKNLEKQVPGEDTLWSPKIQEDKISQYGGKNIRYKHKLKKEFIKQWSDLHDEIIPWNTIRYIF